MFYSVFISGYLVFVRLFLCDPIVCECPEFFHMSLLIHFVLMLKIAFLMEIVLNVKYNYKCKWFLGLRNNSDQVFFNRKLSVFKRPREICSDLRKV